MSWNNINNREQHLSTTIYALRKEGKLHEAYKMALELYQETPDDDIKKAFSWVLIDSCKKFISEQNLDKAQICFNQLSNIKFAQEDEWIATIKKQINLLKPKIDTNYSQIQKADELSRNGNSKEALEIVKNLISENRLTELHHESYGWIIYRHIKAEENNLSSVEIRTFLRDYMILKNERPSMLHSTILSFALNYSKTHNDFNFYNFFFLWNPTNLRYEDLHDGHKDGKNIPSLISRICREFVNSNTEFNIQEFLNKIKLNKDTVLDFFREPIFWKIFNAHKETKFTELWDLFEQYNDNYSKYGQSKWHSEILNLAERLMKDSHEWRFLNFFKNWNPENLRTEDWKETTNEGNTYKPLATKTIKKAFEVLETQKSENNLSWLIRSYEKAIKLFPNDDWLLREKALLHFKNNELDLTIKIYKQLVLELGDKHYVWKEFSDCIISDNFLKIGMLSKALSLEKNEDFLGDIHLDLAKVLIDENLFENALIELETYKKHREIKGWKLSLLFDELCKKISSVKQTLKDNQELYRKYIVVAENFAYADIDWTEVALIDKWKDEKGKERLTFTDGKMIEFAVSKNRFEILKQSELGQILNFKLHKQEIKKEVENEFSWLGKKIIIEYKYIPLIAEKTEKKYWEILENTFCFIDYINKEKDIVHAITTENKETFFPQTKDELHIGDFITAKIYTKKVKDDERIELRKIQKIDKNSVISKFKTQVAIVDGVNEEKQLFHFVISSELQGIVKYSETNLRPNEGDFIRISFVTKADKEKKVRVKVLDVNLTEEINPKLRRDITGLLELKYKNGKNYYDDYDDDDDYDFELDEDGELPDSAFDENGNLKRIFNKIINKPIPDFAFINDFYVPKYLLEKHNIRGDCQVNARVIYVGDKWKVTNIEKI